MSTLLSFYLFTAAAFAQVDRPKIMLTGYWLPTNEMVREFSQSATQNPAGWKGENWEGLGYDVVSYFPEFSGNDRKGHGDFEVDFEDTQSDLARLTAAVDPVALISFGRGAGPWEIEQNFPDFWRIGEGAYHSTLPVEAIALAVNQTGGVRAWVDWAGDPGDFLCGYLSYLGASYRAKHFGQRAIRAQGFIHVGAGFTMADYQTALHATLRALIESLKSEKN